MSSTCTTSVHLLSLGFYYPLGNAPDHCLGSQTLYLTFQREFWEQNCFPSPGDARSIHLSAEKVRPVIFRTKSINESWTRKWAWSGVSTTHTAKQRSLWGHAKELAQIIYLLWQTTGCGYWLPDWRMAQECMSGRKSACKCCGHWRSTKNLLPFEEEKVFSTQPKEHKSYWWLQGAVYTNQVLPFLQCSMSRHLHGIGIYQKIDSL